MMHTMTRWSNVECSLCKSTVLETDVITHLTLCLYSTFYSRGVNAPISHTYRNYYFLALILDLIEDFDITIQRLPPSYTSIIWSIYGYIYANRIGEGYSNIGIGLDCMSRLIIAKIDANFSKKLNLISHIYHNDFTNHFGSIELNVLFEGQELQRLYN